MRALGFARAALVWIFLLFRVAVGFSSGLELDSSLGEGRMNLPTKSLDPNKALELALALSQSTDPEERKVAKSHAESARVEFEKLLLPTSPAELHYKIAISNRLLGNGYTTLHHLKKALSKDPGHGPSIIALAKVYSDKGDVPRATGILEDAIANDFAYAFVKQALGEAYMLVERYRDAAGVFSALTEEQPDNPIYSRALITSYVRLGDFEGIEPILTKLVGDGVMSELDAQLFRAEAIFASGQVSRLRPLISSMKRSDTGHAAVRALEMRFFVESARKSSGEGAFARALLFWNRALSLDPDSQDIQYEIAFLHARTGSFKKASEIFSELLKRPQERPEIFIHAAYTYFALNDFETAMNILRISAETAHEHDDEDGVRLFLRARDRMRDIEDPQKIFEGI